MKEYKIFKSVNENSFVALEPDNYDALLIVSPREEGDYIYRDSVGIKTLHYISKPSVSYNRKINNMMVVDFNNETVSVPENMLPLIPGTTIKIQQKELFGTNIENFTIPNDANDEIPVTRNDNGSSPIVLYYNFNTNSFSFVRVTIDD